MEVPDVEEEKVVAAEFAALPDALRRPTATEADSGKDVLRSYVAGEKDQVKDRERASWDLLG